MSHLNASLQAELEQCRAEGAKALADVKAAHARELKSIRERHSREMLDTAADHDIAVRDAFRCTQRLCAGFGDFYTFHVNCRWRMLTKRTRNKCAP
jgi:hypothetical protein